VSTCVGREGRERKLNKPLVWQKPSHKLKRQRSGEKKYMADGIKQATNNPPF
jgi:hypothetical protein